MLNPSKKLADDVTASIYSSTPIESYGLKMLKKMKSNNTTNNAQFLSRKLSRPPDKIIEFIPRNNRWGLGYDPNSLEKPSSNSTQSSFYGKYMIITSGKYKSMKGKIVNQEKYENFKEFINNTPSIKIQWDINETIVTVKNDSVLEWVQEGKGEEIKAKDKEKVKIEWLEQGLIVRIIDKNSKYYRSKARVEDIVDDVSFSLIMKDGSWNSDFTENDCETVIPRLNEDVKIVSGQYKSQIGKLLERVKKENKVCVQLYDDGEVIKLIQEDVCMV